MCLDSTARCHSKRPSTASVALAGGASLTVYEVGETTRQDAGCLPYTQYCVQEAVRKLTRLHPNSATPPLAANKLPARVQTMSPPSAQAQTLRLTPQRMNILCFKQETARMFPREAGMWLTKPQEGGDIKAIFVLEKFLGYTSRVI